jgi:hypothetical protein
MPGSNLFHFYRDKSNGDRKNVTDMSFGSDTTALLAVVAVFLLIAFGLAPAYTLAAPLAFAVKRGMTKPGAQR